MAAGVLGVTFLGCWPLVGCQCPDGLPQAPKAMHLGAALIVFRGLKIKEDMKLEADFLRCSKGPRERECRYILYIDEVIKEKVKFP